MIDEPKSYRVIRLLAENFKRVKAVDITPGRHAVRVAGKNKAGKTSVLDAIAACLGGKKLMPEQPLRQGAEDGQIVIVLGDGQPELLVKRTFDGEGKTYLEITAQGGFKAPTPQKILDSLYSSIAFDPLAFTRMDDSKQAKTLKELVGLDFSELDAKRKQLYDDRTEIGRVLKAHAAQAEAIVVPEGTPEKPVDVKELVAEINRRLQVNREHQTQRDLLSNYRRHEENRRQDVERLERCVRDLEARLEAAKHERDVADDELQKAHAATLEHESKIADLRDLDVDAVQKEILAAQAINENVGRAAMKASHRNQVQQCQGRIDELTAAIDAIDAQKQEALANAKWPVPGLSFGDSGVLYNGLPFSQASGAEQLAVSFAMASAMNPKLRVALIRDASLLDDEQMQLVCNLAEQYDMQVFMEVVDTEAGPAGVLIEEGLVVEGGTPADAEPVVKPKRQKKAATVVSPDPPDDEDPLGLGSADDTPLGPDDPMGFTGDDSAFLE